MAILSEIRTFFHCFTNFKNSFQILSDLHLEVGKGYLTVDIPAEAPYLILAGDIGRLVDLANYANFLERQIDKFDLIFLVLGNHEFYGLSHQEGLDNARQLVARDSLKEKVVLLDRIRFDLPNSKATILGCTLWSLIPDSDKDIVKSKVKDFQRIEDWTIESHNTTHKSDVAWLRSQVDLLQKMEPSKPIIIITHYPPCKEHTSRPEHINNPWSSAFATDLLEPRAWPGVKLWVFGHTHYSNDFKKDGIRLVGNQRGYALNPKSIEGSRGRNGYDVRKVVKI